MSLTIGLAHSGGILKADGHSFASVDEFRRWIHEQTGLPVECQILMTSRATNVKTSSLGVEKEIYVYDRRLLELSAKPLLDPIPKPVTLKSFPADLESDTDMASWRTLFKNRKAWAEYAQSQAESLAQRIRQTDHETMIMKRSVTVAFASLETHSKKLDTSLSELREWATGVAQDRDRLLLDWEPAVQKLIRIPLNEGFSQIAQGDKSKKKVKVLSDLFDIKEVQKAAATADMLAERFQNEVSELGGLIESICSRTAELGTNIQQTSRPNGNLDNDLAALREDIDVLVQKIRSDYDFARQLQGPKAPSSASKRAHASTFEHLPGMIAVVDDMSRLLVKVIERKNATNVSCLEHLQVLAQIQSATSPVHPRINALDVAHQEEAAHFQLLNLVIQLPHLYGSLLIECVRRREWSEKFSGDSQRLAEELALIKEDEEKRRRKWHRNTGSQLPFDLDNSSQAIRTEVNTRGDLSGGLPNISRKDVEQYISSLRPLDGMNDIIKELTQSLQDLDKPSKKINKRLRGFKMGSVHEASLMGASFLAGNAEEVKTLRAEKANLTERIKGYESRIRKLEDLLHRTRTSSNTGHPGTSPTPVNGMSHGPMTPDVQSGLPSTSHRRSSSEAVAMIEPLQARIAMLEALLAAEKDTTANLLKEATAKTESEKEMNARISQADDTKRDLIANLEALNQQHITERKDMQKDIEDLKQKLEEAYEDLDRLEEEKLKGMESELNTLGAEASKLRELHTADSERINSLTKELEEVREEAEKQRKRADVEFQRAEEAEASLTSSEQATTRLVEQVATLEKQLKETKEALEAAHQKHNGSYEALINSMKGTYRQLSSEPPIEDANKLMEQIDSLVATIVSRNTEFSEKLAKEEANVESLKSQNARLQARFDARTMKAKDLTQRLYTHNARSIQLLESLGYRVIRGDDSIQIVKISKNNASNESTVLVRSNANLSLNESTVSTANQPAKPSPLASAQTSTVEDINLLYWMESPDSDTETEKYGRYIKTIGAFDLDAFSEAIVTRVKKTEADFKLLNKQARAYREKYYRAREEAAEKIAFRSFKSGDIALFLPTRNQATRPWAAFNVGAPHYFLREQDSHKLATRDWLLARITKVEERIVDLSRSTASANLLPSSDNSETPSTDDENPFELSDGLRWYLLDAVEEKPGAPTTPGLSSSTVAAANVDAKGSLKSRKPVSGAKKKLTDITVEQARRTSSGGGSNRNSLALSDNAAAAVRAGLSSVLGTGQAVPESAVIDGVPASPRAPRTPIEKVVSVTRSRAASLRSLAGTPQPPQSSGNFIAAPAGGVDGFRYEEF